MARKPFETARSGFRAQARTGTPRSPRHETDGGEHEYCDLAKRDDEDQAVIRLSKPEAFGGLRKQQQ
jgi:hypothetical protein